jgi:hypothetical protein
MAGVAEFRGDRISVAPVEGCLSCASKEVGAVSGQGDACNSAHHFSFTLDKHVLAADLGNSAVTSSGEQVTVGEKGKAVDSLLKESLGGADSLVEETLKVYLDNVTGEGPDEGGGISRVNNNALEFTLDLAHVDFLGGDLLGD